MQEAEEPVAIHEPSILIQLSLLYRPDMSALELYDITRGVWTIGSRRSEVRLALAVYEDIVREVYEIHNWHRAGTTLYESGREIDRKHRNRWEFTGVVAAPEIRDRYLNQPVGAYFTPGSQSPIRYVGNL